MCQCHWKACCGYQWFTNNWELRNHSGKVTISAPVKMLISTPQKGTLLCHQTFLVILKAKVVYLKYILISFLMSGNQFEISLVLWHQWLNWVLCVMDKQLEIITETGTILCRWYIQMIFPDRSISMDWLICNWNLLTSLYLHHALMKQLIYIYHHLCPCIKFDPCMDDKSQPL